MARAFDRYWSSHDGKGSETKWAIAACFDLSATVRQRNARSRDDEMQDPGKKRKWDQYDSMLRKKLENRFQSLT